MSRKSARFSLADRLLALNNNLAAGASRHFGVKVKGDHAWFSVKHNGKTYIFNGNDGMDGIPVHYPPSADGSDVPGIRALADRDEKILVHPGGLCYLVSCGLSKAYKTIGRSGEDWERFFDFAMSCTEEDLYLLLTQ